MFGPAVAAVRLQHTLVEDEKKRALHILRKELANAPVHQSGPALKLAKTTQAERRDIFVEVQSTALKSIVGHPPDRVRKHPVSQRSVKKKTRMSVETRSRARAQHSHVLNLDKVQSNDDRMRQRTRGLRDKQARTASHVQNLAESQMLSDQWADRYVLKRTVVVSAGAIAVVVGDRSHDVVVVSGDPIAGEWVLSCFPGVEVAAISAEGAEGTVGSDLLNDHDWYWVGCWDGCWDGCWVEYVENRKPDAVTVACQ
jgi:hypothetical protein